MKMPEIEMVAFGGRLKIILGAPPQFLHYSETNYANMAINIYIIWSDTTLHYTTQNN